MKNKLNKKREVLRSNIMVYVVLLMGSFSYAQVGVGNTNPQATLDITASNQASPSNKDGILIPRIDDFPSTPPTVAQDGMLVYLTTTVGLNSKGFYHWDQATTSWIRFSSIEKLNDLTDAKSDNDGTNDGSSIFIGINAGLNDDADHNQNVGVGYNALMTNLNGDANSAFGFEALSLNTSINNSAFGFRALATNSSGRRNSAFGRGALEGNTTANFNTAMGTQALATNTTGASNVALGEMALFNNETGSGNTAVGTEALTNNTAIAADGSSTAVGYRALYKNEDGVRNTAVGYEALNSSISQNNNSAFGHAALSTNTAGNNTAVGSYAGQLSSGNSGVFVGVHAGNNRLTGNDNVFVGMHAGRGENVSPEITTGNSNVYIGKNTGRGVTGDSNVFIGNAAGYDNAFDTTSNTLLIQNESDAIPLIYGDFANDRVGIGKIATTNALEVEGTTEATQYKLSALNIAPASATAAGVEGEIRVTSTHIYVCIAANTWVRANLATW